jgi:hypothetical protein
VGPLFLAEILLFPNCQYSQFVFGEKFTLSVIEVSPGAALSLSKYGATFLNWKLIFKTVLCNLYSFKELLKINKLFLI